MQRIALIDDDTQLCAMLEEYFGNEGFFVQSFYDGGTGLEAALSQDWDLLILDVCLPDWNGFELLGKLRAESCVPILMLTGRGEVVDKVVGLEIGADDYLSKPFEPRELLARVRALVRRTRKKADAEPTETKTITAGDVVLNTGTRRVYVNGAEVRLTNVEFIILHMLVTAGGSLVSRETISQNALHRDLAPYDRSIDVHISNLRRKLGPPPWGGSRIATMRGAGYMYTAFEPSDTNAGGEPQVFGSRHKES